MTIFYFYLISINIFFLILKANRKVGNGIGAVLFLLFPPGFLVIRPPPPAMRYRLVDRRNEEECRVF